MPRFTSSQIRSLEEKFTVSLPEFYIDFLQNHDERLESIKVEAGPLGENDLTTSFEGLVELNEGVRDPALWYFGEHPWPGKFFVIGINGYGCHYFVDTSGEHPGVLFQDIYDWDIHPMASDCYALIERLQKERLEEERGYQT